MEGTTTTTHRITEFHKWHKSGNLILNPHYQRNPVWPVRNKCYLIDTILQRLPVPEIYMQIKTDKDGNSMYEIVDGQQRMRSILEFIEGEYELLEDESPEYAGKDFSRLTDGDKKDFWDYQLVVREIRTNSEADIRELFRRLNKYVMPLNDQERRHATYFGEFIKLVENFALDGFWAENGIAKPAEIKRMKDVEFVSELLIAIMDGIQTGTDDLDKFYALYDTDFREKDKWQKHFDKVQQGIEEIFDDLRGTNWNTKSDFYSLFVGLSQLLENHILLIVHKEQIKKVLVDFRARVNVEKEKTTDEKVKVYFETLQHGTNQREIRARRTKIVKDLLLPFVIPKAHQRGFTEEQRQLVWDMSPDKTCLVCAKIINQYGDYELDHIKPHSQGGDTVLSNAQLAHKKCNRSKGAR